MTATLQVCTAPPQPAGTGCVHTVHGFVSTETASPTLPCPGTRRTEPTRCGRAAVPQSGAPRPQDHVRVVSRSADSVQPSRAHAPPSPMPLPAPLVALRARDGGKGLDRRLCHMTGSHGASWHEERCGHGQQTCHCLVLSSSCLWDSSGRRWILIPKT